MRALLWSSLVFLVAICALVAGIARYQWKLDGTNLSSGPIIFPGHEPAVMELLSPLLRNGLHGHGVADIQIVTGEIRIQLAAPSAAVPSTSCRLPDWARSPGALGLVYRPGQPDTSVFHDASGAHAVSRGLVLSWTLCADGAGSSLEMDTEAAALLAQLSDRHHGDIWGLSDRQQISPGQDYGLLTPVIHGTGMHGASILGATFVMSLALSAAFAVWVARSGGRFDKAQADSDQGSTQRLRRMTWAVLLLLLGAGVWLRMRAAVTMPLDSDEVWSLPNGLPVFSGDHDSWTHPPVHRLLQQAWVHAAGWRDGQPLWWIRLPSVVCSTLALFAVAASIAVAHARPWAAIPFGVLALSPQLVDDSVLARPYGLSALFISLAAVACWARVPDEPPATRALRWCVALTATGLAGWADLIAGIIAAIMLVVRLAEKDAPSRRHVTLSRAMAVAIAVLWTAVLIPGALDASVRQVQPAHDPDPKTREVSPSASGYGQETAPSATESGGTAGPDLRSERGMGGGHPLAFARRLFCFGISGIPFDRAFFAFVAFNLTLVFAAAGLRTPSGSAGVAVLVAAVALVVLSMHLGMRSRNVLVFPYFLLSAWSWIASHADRKPLPGRWARQ